MVIIVSRHVPPVDAVTVRCFTGTGTTFLFSFVYGSLPRFARGIRSPFVADGLSGYVKLAPNKHSRAFTDKLEQTLPRGPVRHCRMNYYRNLLEKKKCQKLLQRFKSVDVLDTATSKKRTGRPDEIDFNFQQVFKYAFGKISDCGTLLNLSPCRRFRLTI